MSHQPERPRAPSGRRGTGPVGWLVDHPQDRAGAVGERLDDLGGGGPKPSRPCGRPPCPRISAARPGNGLGNMAVPVVWVAKRVDVGVSYDTFNS